MRLFKYFASSRASILTKRLIRFTQPVVFNDPFEFLPCIKSIATDLEYRQTLEEAANKDFSELYESVGAAGLGISKEVFFQQTNAALLKFGPAAQQMLKALIPQAQKKLYDSFNEHIGVLCLSERNDDLLMWAHYADCHKGFVIEFDPESDFFNQRRGPADSLRHLRKVKYSHKRPAITLSETSEEEFFLTKSDHWKYEAEWRMMMALADFDEKQERDDGDVYLFRFPASAIKSVVFGSKMPESLSDSIMRDVAFLEGYEHVDFFKASIHPTDYELTIEQAWP